MANCLVFIRGHNLWGKKSWNKKYPYTVPYITLCDLKRSWVLQVGKCYIWNKRVEIMCSKKYSDYAEGSVADPDPSDPYVFEPPGSRFGSIYHQAKIVRKTWFVTFFFFLSLKNDWNVPCFLLASWRSMRKIAGSGSISQRHESADPDPYQNVIDPQHWLIWLW